MVLLGIGPEAYIVDVSFHPSTTGYKFLHLIDVFPWGAWPPDAPVDTRK